MLVAAVFCVAVFGAGAVWAYNANLAMKLPASLTFKNITLKVNDNTIYTNGTINNQNFTITPIAENTLEVSATYQTFGNTKTIAFSSGYTMSLVKAVAYDVNLGVGGGNAYASGAFANSTLTITLGAEVMPVSTDIITFQILFS